eukprot:g15113.t1
MFRVYNTIAPWTITRRTTVLLTDTVVDLLCILLPLGFIWIVYKVPVTVWEVTMIVAWPSFCLLMKLRTLMKQNILSRVVNERIRLEQWSSVKQCRHRKSIFRVSELEKLVEVQGNSVPLTLKRWFRGFSMCAGLFFLTTGIVAFSVSPSCDEELWSGCEVRVPFCQFRVSCNCAVLQIKKHNMTALPPAIEAMTAMKKMQINHGPLEQLPELGEFMPALAELNVDFNALTTLPASLAKAPNLVILYASFNQIAHIPEELFQHQGINLLDLSTNNIRVLPELKMKQLQYLYVVNNSLAVLPESLFSHNSISQIVVDGNDLDSLPLNIGNVWKTLKLFGAARNNLTSVPSSFSQLSNLNVLDLRNNSLTSLPPWDQLTSLTYLTVAGNPLCTNGWQSSGKVRELMANEGEGCTRQCSDMCLNMYLYNDGCDAACNVPECNYDNRQCV